MADKIEFGEVAAKALADLNNNIALLMKSNGPTGASGTEAASTANTQVVDAIAKSLEGVTALVKQQSEQTEALRADLKKQSDSIAKANRIEVAKTLVAGTNVAVDDAASLLDGMTPENVTKFRTIMTKFAEALKHGVLKTHGTSRTVNKSDGDGSEHEEESITVETPEEANALLEELASERFAELSKSNKHVTKGNVLMDLYREHPKLYALANGMEIPDDE